MSPVKTLTLGLALTFFICLFAWPIFFPNQNIEQKIKQTLDQQKNRADLLLKEVTFSETQGGTKYWELDAKTSTLNKDMGEAELNLVNGRFYKNNLPVLYFISPKVFWNMEQKEITINHPFGYDSQVSHNLSVLLKNIDLRSNPVALFRQAANYSGKVKGAWFLANHLNWKLKTQKLTCRDGVLMSHGALTVFAQNLDGQVDFASLSFTGNPTALYFHNQLTSGKRAITTATAREFKLLSQSNQIHALDDVRLFSDSTEIHSQRAEYFPNSEKILLLGNVEILYKDLRATCKQTEYLLKENYLILSGSALAKRGPNQLRGEKIEINLTNGKIKVIGKTKIKVEEMEK